jgi:tRNA (adenine57-N1/adenine58-N1)-methyltransferase
MAQKEFKEMGFDKFITVTHRDVLENGFDLDIEVQGEKTNLDDRADAVFLDLPSPWKALKHAYKVLKHNGRICNFSPCIEQVQKVCLEMNNLKFSHIRTFEVLARPYTSKNRGYEYVKYSGGEESDEEEEKGYMSEEVEVLQQPEEPSNDKKKKKRDRKRDEKKDEKREAKRKEEGKLRNRNKILISELTQKIKGHTGYLTFATCNKQLGKIEGLGRC